MDDDQKFNADQLMSAQWMGVGSGSFNQVFVSRKPITLKINGQAFCQRWVRKKPLERNLQSESRRAVRVWNDIHPEMPALQSPLNRQEWIAPYFGFTKATDLQTAKAVIDVYKQTGRIVVDACGSGNALVHEGQAKIIDIDVALAPRSPASKDFAWREIQYNPVSCGYDVFWDGHLAAMPKTVNVIKTIYYLDQQLGDSTSVRDSLSLAVIELLHPYRKACLPIDASLIHQLAERQAEDAAAKAEQPDYGKARFFQQAPQVEEAPSQHRLSF